MNLSEIFAKILDILYYRSCYICSKKCDERCLCESCLDKINSSLKFFKTEKFNTIIYSGGIYENELLKIIRAIKYHKKQMFKNILADIIIKTIEHYNLDLNDFIVCPVPIHPNRFKHRKYNHMELVANIVAEKFGLEMRSDLLFRIKDTQPLYKLSGDERKNAIKNAFKSSPLIKDKKILLIDDIITTGSTIKELSKIIFEQNPENFIVICASRSNKCNL